MINLAVIHITNYLNQFLKRSFDLSEDIVVPSNIVEQDGSVSNKINNKIIVSLVNIEKDTTPVHSPRSGAADSNRAIASYPPVYLNLYLIFSSHFSNYNEALKFLSHTISFFQRTPIINHQNSPDLDKQISTLAFDIENLNIRDLSSLWGIISTKYLPSILYKVRMITFDAKDVKEQIPKAKSLRSSLQH